MRIRRFFPETQATSRGPRRAFSRGQSESTDSHLPLKPGGAAQSTPRFHPQVEVPESCGLLICRSESRMAQCDFSAGCQTTWRASVGVVAARAGFGLSAQFNAVLRDGIQTWKRCRNSTPLSWFRQ